MADSRTTRAPVFRPGHTRRTWLGAAARTVLLALALLGALAACSSPPSRLPKSSGTPGTELVLAPTTQAVATAEATPEPTEEPTPPPTAVAPSTTPVIAAASTATPARPTPRPAPQVVRVRIPALSVDAPIQQMSFDSAGVMEVPQNPTTVAWYGFSALPGNPGNAVMAAHVTWGGARAVFNQLGTLRPGDVIEVRTGEGDVRYVVQRSYLVRPEEADVQAIVGPRDGPQTLTLITCGGSFNSAIREYDHRVIVFATRA